MDVFLHTEKKVSPHTFSEGKNERL